MKRSGELGRESSGQSFIMPRETELKLGKRVLGSVAAQEPLELTPKEKADAFLWRHGRMLSLFSKDSSLRFEPNESIETFAFRANDCKVLVPLQWFEDERYTEEELEFANYHERAHFIDMRKNPDAYLGKFDDMESDAERLARSYLRKHPKKATLESVKKFYYKELSALYNCLDDIYVNDLVTSRIPFFRTGDGKDDIVSLYEKLNLGDADLTNQPLHSQLSYALLRDAMVGDKLGPSKVDARVEKVLSKKLMGKTLRQLVNTELKTDKGKLVDPAERNRIIRTLIQPLYLSLLETAIEEQEESDDSNQNNDNGDRDKNNNNTLPANISGDHGETNKKNSTDGKTANSFDPFAKQRNASQPHEAFDKSTKEDEIIKDILKGMKENDKVRKMSPRERADYEAKKRMEEFDRRYGIAENERSENEAIKPTIAKARREMREFWKRLVGKSKQYHLQKVSGQRRGTLNINSFINKYPEIIEAERQGNLREMEVYDRIGLEQVMVEQPESIDVTLLVDCSFSMNGDREEAAKKTAALLMYSLKDFNDELNRTRSQTHSRLRAYSQVITFGSKFKEIKPFDKKSSNNESDAHTIKAISQINSSSGGTDDAAPLKWISANLSADEKSKIKAQKLKKIVFEITDGSPDSPAATSERIRALAEDGIVVVGFQIGSISEDNRKTFDTIWNGSDSRNSVGIYIGENINTLPQRLMSELSNLLGNIVA